MGLVINQFTGSEREIVEERMEEAINEWMEGKENEEPKMREGKGEL